MFVLLLQNVSNEIGDMHPSAAAKNNSLCITWSNMRILVQTDHSQHTEFYHIDHLNCLSIHRVIGPMVVLAHLKNNWVRFYVKLLCNRLLLDTCIEQG